MIAGEQPGDLWIVGPGRMGLALAGAMVRSGWSGNLTFIGRTSRRPPIHGPGSMADARYATPYEAGRFPPPTTLLITVPDSTVTEAASVMASLDLPPAIALHTSGALPSAALEPLASKGWKTGSIHPLVAVPDPDAGAGKLCGAWFGIEGEAEAVEAARGIVRLLGGNELILDTETKPLYHAAAVMASNHVVALLDVAVRMMTRCGVEPTDAAAALGALAAGAVEDVAAKGSLQALTGPVLRGDAATVWAHLGQLSGDDSRLYSVLAREALRIAAARGLPPGKVATIEAILLEKPG